MRATPTGRRAPHASASHRPEARRTTAMRACCRRDSVHNMRELAKHHATGAPTRSIVAALQRRDRVRVAPAARRRRPKPKSAKRSTNAASGRGTGASSRFEQDHSLEHVQMSAALDLYAKLTETTDEKERAHLIASAFDALEARFPQINDLATKATYARRSNARSRSAEGESRASNCRSNRSRSICTKPWPPRPAGSSEASPPLVSS